MQKIKLSLVDDQKIFRQMLSIYFAHKPEIELIGDFVNGSEFLKFLASNPQSLPEIVIMDIDMPVMGGIELTSHLQQDYPGIKIIVLSFHNEDFLISKMIRAGASGYLDKNCECSELEQAIHTVSKTGFYMNPKIIRSLGRNPFEKGPADLPEVKLSPRELEVLEMICREYTNTEIAENLFISVRTVDGHRNSLLNKTGSRNTAGLVLHAARVGLINL